MSTTEAKKKTEFGTVEKVISVIKPMEDIERVRANDRAKIDSLFNGQRPYTAQEEKDNQIPVNVNWGMGKKILRDANVQVNSALLHQGPLFTCTLEAGKPDKRDEWSAMFTKLIHKPIQRGKSGKRHSQLMRNQNASVCLHGIGALMWYNPSKWMPRFVGLEDLLIPTETYSDFSNLRYFAVNLYLTTGELIEMTQGDKVNPGWNKKMVADILEWFKDLHSEGVPSTWRDQPEAMANIYKENKGYYYSDATPKVRCRWFFYQSLTDPKKWYRCLILRECYGNAKPADEFLFDGSSQPFADDIDQILAVQYGDNNFVPPLKYHCVRGLGVDLYAPVEELNRLFCEFIWAVHIDFRILFKIKDPTDRDRLKQVVLAQFGTIPEGLEMMKREERYQIKPELFNEAVNVMRGNLQDSSASFIKDQEANNSKVMTAKEAMIRSNQANTLVSTMLQSMYYQAGYYYQELVRRFLKTGSEDDQVKEFQDNCIKSGIPKELLKPQYWKIAPEMVLGGGDKTQAQEEATWLWANKAQFDPSVQQKLSRLAVGTLLNNFDKANELVPMQKVTSTSGTILAAQFFGTLMTGNQCPLVQGIDQQGYVETLIQMMGTIVQRINQTGGTTTIDEVIGLGVVSQNISQHIMILAGDEQQKPLVKQLGDALGQVLNEVKGIAQRTMEKEQADKEAQDGDPATAAKAKSTMMLAQTKAQIAQAEAAAKMKREEVLFALEQQRLQVQLASEIKRDRLKTEADMSNKRMSAMVKNLQTMRSAKNKDKSG